MEQKIPSPRVIIEQVTGERAVGETAGRVLRRRALKAPAIDQLTDETLLRKVQLADIVNVTTKTLENWHAAGLPVIRVSNRLSLYRWGSIRAWLKKREVSVVAPSN